MDFTSLVSPVTSFNSLKFETLGWWMSSSSVLRQILTFPQMFPSSVVRDNFTFNPYLEYLILEKSPLFSVFTATYIEPNSHTTKVRCMDATLDLYTIEKHSDHCWIRAIWLHVQRRTRDTRKKVWSAVKSATSGRVSSFAPSKKQDSGNIINISAIVSSLGGVLSFFRASLIERLPRF